MPQSRSFFRIAATLTAMAMVLLVAASIRYGQSRGLFAAVPDKTLQCRTVEGLSSITAIVPSPSGALIATRSGGLYRFTDRATRIAGFSRDAVALALSLAAQPDRSVILQAVMARRDGTFYVAAFRLAGDAAEEIGRLTTDMLTDPADIAAVDGARFYLVNRHGSKTALGRWLDDSFLLPRAEILYFDGMRFVPVAKRLNSPAALALTADGAHLFVGQDYLRNLVAFSRSDFTGSIENPALTNLPAGPQRITLAPDGSLIVTASPKRGSGAVWRLRLAGGVLQKPELLFGSPLEEITAAAAIPGHLLIGSPTRLRDCAQ